MGGRIGTGFGNPADDANGSWVCKWIQVKAIAKIFLVTVAAELWFFQETTSVKVRVELTYAPRCATASLRPMCCVLRTAGPKMQNLWFFDHEKERSNQDGFRT